ncbi:MAG: hypothetical protein QXI16_05460, partial [Sulfolobaceae archaeon]
IELFGEVGKRAATTKTLTYTFQDNLADLYRVGDKQINESGWIAAKRISYMTSAPDNTADKYYYVPVLSQRAKEHYNYYYPNDDISLENNPDVYMEYQKLNAMKVNGIENPIKVKVVDNYKLIVYEDTLGDGTVNAENTIVSDNVVSSAYMIENPPEFNIYDDGRIVLYAYYCTKADTRNKSAYSLEISNHIKSYSQQSEAVVESVQIENTDTVTYNRRTEFPESIKLPNVEDKYDDLVGMTPDDVIGDKSEIGNPPETDRGIFISIWEWLQTFWTKLRNLISELNVKSLVTDIRNNTEEIKDNIATAGDSDSTNFDGNARRFNLPDLFILFLDVLLACIMLVLRFIAWLVTMPGIPATDALLSPEIISAYNFVRNQNIPIFNITLITLVSLVLTFTFSVVIVRKVKGVNSV